MGRISRLIASFALLGTAACTADGPLEPQLAPEPARMQRSAETPRTAPEFAQWLSSAGLMRADGREPMYIVDGVVWPTGSIGLLDLSSVEHIERLKPEPTAYVLGCRATTDVVIIATRAQR